MLQVQQNTSAFAYAIIVLLMLSRVTTEHQEIIKINSDGSVADTSQLPKCSDGARINLLSYTIMNENCLSNIDCDVQLSAAQHVYIHQKCSLKEACEAMDFPIKDSRSDINGEEYFLKVKYECLDHFTEFLDMCDNISKPIYNNVHLLSTQSYETRKECHCSIKDGRFSLVLNDIRLLSTDGHRCSNSELQIGFDSFYCTPMTDGYGSVFNQRFSETQMTSISLILRDTQETKDTLPQMIWLIIKPKESLRITCGSSTWSHKTTTPGPNSASLTLNYTHSTYSTLSQKEDGSSPAIYIIPIIIGVFVVAVLACVIIWRRGKFKRHKRSNTQAEPVISKTGANGKTTSDTELSVENTGKADKEEVEMTPLMETKDTHNREATNKEESENIDNGLNSIVSTRKGRIYKQNVKPRQEDIAYYPEPPEYKPDLDRMIELHY